MAGNTHLIKGSNFDDIFRELIWNLSSSPQYVCSPRGSLIKENLAVTLVLTNPRARLLSCKKRATNYGFGVGEFLWYWQGKQDLETMLYYNKRMKDFSDDGKTLNSAYGFRLRNMMFRPITGDCPTYMNQWESAWRTLEADPDSRRALLLINLPGDEIKATVVGSKDVPCTLSLQFFIRNGRLDMHAHMRSNDVMWGLTYDLFSFTLFQECMLLDLQRIAKFKDLQLGNYYHTAGSLHLYQHHFEQAEEITREYGLHVDWKPPMEPLQSLERLDHLCQAEELLREGRSTPIRTSDFEGSLAWMAEQLNDHWTKRQEEARKKNG